MSYDYTEPDPMGDLSDLADAFADPDAYGSSGHPDPIACRASEHPEAWERLLTAHRQCLFAALVHKRRRDADLDGDPALAAAAQPCFDAAVYAIQEAWREAVTNYSLAFNYLDLVGDLP